MHTLIFLFGGVIKGHIDSDLPDIFAFPSDLEPFGVFPGVEDIHERD